MKLPFLRVGAIWGVFLGLVIMLPYWLRWGMPFDTQQQWGYMAMGFCSMVTVLLSIRYALKMSTGAFPLRKGFGAGLRGMLFGSLMLAVFLVLAFEVLSPSLAESLYNQYVDEVLNDTTLTDELRAERLKGLEDYKRLNNGYLQGVVMGITYFFFGLVLSVIGAFFLRRK